MLKEMASLAEVITMSVHDAKQEFDMRLATTDGAVSFRKTLSRPQFIGRAVRRN
jgi:hypothetical protein